MEHVSPAPLASSYSRFPFLALPPMCCLGLVSCVNCLKNWAGDLTNFILCRQSHVCSHQRFRKLFPSGIADCSAGGYEQCDCRPLHRCGGQAEAAHSTWRGLQGICSTTMLPLVGCIIQSIPYPVPLVGHGNERGSFYICLSMVQDLGK